MYALIRDNVQHHLEAGAPTPMFAGIHAVSTALGGQSISLSAAQLAREMAIVERDLLPLPASNLALSARTRAVIHFQWPEVAGPATEIVGPLEVFGTLVRNAKSLGDVFGGVVSALHDLATRAGPHGSLEVTDT